LTSRSQSRAPTDELHEDSELAVRISSRLFGEPAPRVTPIVGRGSVNRVFVVEASGRGAVLRMSDRDEAPDEYAKEAWCMARAAERGVPVPSVLGAGREEGLAYVVHSYIHGDEGRQSAVPKPRLWRELGRYARIIHTIPVPGFGLKLSEITRGDARRSWLRHVDYNIESLNDDDPLLRLGVMTPPQSRAVRRVFIKLRERRFTFGLNHGDISLKNVVVGAGGRVSLLDWGCAEAAVVPHHELIELLKMQMLEGDPDGEQLGAFLEGYGISPAEFARMTPELESLLTLRAFDKLRWALDRNVEELEGYVSHAREALGRCLG
jgi:aminoglycoside phosphotransferase (APT) family kinase protein